MTLEAIRDRLPEAARDLKLNLQSVLEGGSLEPRTRWGIALACAITTGDAALRDAIAEAAAAHTDDAVIEDARAAAALMAMNNVYYRFRHMVGKPSYSTRAAGLRMNRIVRPATSRTEFELYCLAVSAINGCEACIQAHEKVVVEGGLTEDNVNDAIRIAATVRGVAVARSI